MFLIFELILLAIFGALAYGYYRIFVGEYVLSQPNEWMIVLNNGKIKAMGVGITSRVSYFDSCVKFPSKIHKVHFNAQQVTQEMQGIEVSGVILWSINPKDDLPLKAVKYLGKDLTYLDAKTAKDNLAEMCSAIVQHNIANSTIEEILKQRDMLRDSISKGISSVIEGWGCLIESVEITDVKILSSKLFKNLQMQYREEQRKKAELINMNTEKQLKERRLVNNLKREIQNLQDQTETEISKNKQKMKVSSENLKMYVKQQQIDLEKTQKSREMKKKMLHNEMEVTKRQNEESAKLSLLQEKIKTAEDLQRREKELRKKVRTEKAEAAKREIKLLESQYNNKKLREDAAIKEKMTKTNELMLKLGMMKKLFKSGDMYNKISLTSFGKVNEDPCMAMVRRVNEDIEGLADHLTHHSK